MSNHYAIELSLMLYQEDQWMRSFTYYNHGEEPPYGGVRADEALSPFAMSIGELRENIKSIDSFIRTVIDAVKAIKPIPKNPIPDRPLEYGVSGYDDTIEYHIEMETLQLTVVYDKTTKEITFNSRPAYDVSWQGFLFYHETIRDFLVEIERS